MQNKSLIIILLIITTIILGYFRGYIFVSINAMIETGNAGAYLLSLKWLLTFVFSILYFLLTYIFLVVIFRSQKYLWLSAGVYVFLFTVSFFAAVIGKFITSFENVYPFVRSVIEIAQSPIVLMILIPACFINESVSSQR